MNISIDSHSSRLLIHSTHLFSQVEKLTPEHIKHLNYDETNVKKMFFIRYFNIQG